MDRLTRKELKSDKFVVEVQHGVEYVSEHRRQMVLWSTVAAVVVVIGAAWYVYSTYQHGVREQKLAEALRIQNSNVGPASPNPWMLTFPTEQARDKAANTALTELATRYSGTDEGTIADYLLGSAAVGKGNMSEAERRLRNAVDNGSGPYASLAKLSLARVLSAEGKNGEAETLLRGLIDKPTVFVSKEAATLALAQMIEPSRPQEARKLLEPLRTERSGVSKAAIDELGKLPLK